MKLPPINRRKFLGVAGGGALGVATSGVTVQGLSALNAAIEREEVHVPRGPEAWRLSVCSLCPAGCGLRVRTLGKRAVRIQGNPLHPVNRGGLCPRGVAGLQVLYHPDRLHAPQKNIGSREAPRWKEIAWDEATNILAQRLGGLQKQQPHSVVFISGNCGHLRQRLFRRFLSAYGSPNFFHYPPKTDGASAAAFLQQGVTDGIAYDLEGTQYVLSFGANLLEGWGSPVSTMRAFGSWRDSSAGRRTKFVQIEPRLSPTAARADEWVAVKPGTEAALALGMAYVLITEGLLNTQFIEEHTFGFEDWKDASGRTHTGFRSLVLSEYRLNEVAAITQAPIETILRVAREFGRNRPAIAIGGRAGHLGSVDLYTAMAVHSLNALVGSLEVPGGLLVRPEIPGDEELHGPGRNHLPASAVNLEEHPLLPWADVSRLPDAISSAKPHPIQAVLVHGTDPVFSLPNGERFAQALRRVPFVVSFASFLNETSACADLLLPDCTDLEKWQESASPPTFEFPLVSISPPVVEPAHKTRDTADVLLAVARALGGHVGAALPEPTFEEFLRGEVGKLFAAQAGYTFSSSLEETWNRMSERSGWWAPTFTTREALWEQIKEKGGWWEPTNYYGEWNRVLRTPSGRFEFYSQRLAEWAKNHPEVVKANGLQPGDDHVCLPHQPHLPDAPKEFPLLLIPVEVLPFAGGQGAELPYLQQIAGHHVFEHWESWLEMNPQTAAELGLEDGEQVRVESPRGSATVRLRLYAGARPGVVHLPLGYGRTYGSAWACRGVNPLKLVAGEQKPPMETLQPTQTFVRVRRI